MAALTNLRPHGYQPHPLRRVYIPKAKGKRRPLRIATMRDRAMQMVYLFALDPVAEVRADPHSYGFRVGRSTAAALAQCFTALCRKRSARYVLEGDIRACFDEICPQWLLDHGRTDTAMLRRWLKAGYYDGGKLFQTQRGAAQGGPLSPALANWTLDGLEKVLDRQVPNKYPPTRWSI